MTEKVSWETYEEAEQAESETGKHTSYCIRCDRFVFTEEHFINGACREKGTE